METIQQIERCIHKIIAHYPATQDAVLTDIHLQVKPESGEILVYNDDDEELNRCVIDEWINSPDEESFYAEVTPILCQCIQNMRPQIDEMAVMHPFSFVLVDEDHETLSDIYLVDDEQVIVSGELLPGLDDELDTFLKELLG